MEVKILGCSISWVKDSFVCLVYFLSDDNNCFTRFVETENFITITGIKKLKETNSFCNFCNNKRCKIRILIDSFKEKLFQDVS